MPDFTADPQRLLLLFAPHQHVCQGGERRVSHRLAELQFLLIEGRKIVRCRLPNA